MKVEFYYPQQARHEHFTEMFEDVPLALAEGTWYWDNDGIRHILRIPREKTGRTWWVAAVDPPYEPEELAAVVDLVRLQWGAP